MCANDRDLEAQATSLDLYYQREEEILEETRYIIDGEKKVSDKELSRVIEASSDPLVFQSNDKDLVFAELRKDQARGISYDNVSIEQIIEDYRSENAFRQERAAEMAIKKYNNLIYTTINRYFKPYYNQYFEDMVQEGRKAIIHTLGLYDPAKSMKTTLFVYHIRRFISLYIYEYVHQTSIHFASRESKVRDAMEYFTSKGVYDYTAWDISRRTGISVKTVEGILTIVAHRALYLEDLSIDSKDDDMPVIEIPSNELSPEEAYWNNEIKKAFEDALSQLLKIEREVFLHKHAYYGEENTSEKKIVERLGIPIDNICPLYNSALHKLRSNKKLADMCGYHIDDSLVDELLSYKQDTVTVIEDQANREMLLDLDLDF